MEPEVRPAFLITHDDCIRFTTTDGNQRWIIIEQPEINLFNNADELLKPPKERWFRRIDSGCNNHYIYEEI